MNNLNNFLFKKEFEYSCVIEKLSKEKLIRSFIASRVAALGISAFALINVLNDIAYMGFSLLSVLAHSIRHLESPLKYCSTTRNIAVFAFEFFRHLSGLVFGSLLGIISPVHAAKWMLPTNQKSMEIREQNMTKEQVQKLYAMTKEVHQLFVEKGIEYCMTGGTQLGATRHEGIIPWDDDVDLFVLEKDESTINSLKSALEAKGIGMIRCHLGFKFFDLNGSDINESHSGEDYTYKYPFIDICFAGVDQKGHYTYTGEHFRNNYAGEYLTEEEWKGRHLQKFGDLSLYGAPDPEKFCMRMYGEDVFDYGYQLLNHRNFKLEIPRKFYLEKNQFGKCRSIDDVLKESEANLEEVI